MATVTHDSDGSRFTAGDAYLSYTRKDDVLDIQHTIVPKELSGQGVGSDLVEAAVTYADAEGLEVQPSCSFAKDWLDKRRAA